MALEREIKLRFASVEDARAGVRAIGAVPLRGRRLQEDVLLDTADDVLQDRRAALRVRHDAGRWFVTFKGAPLPGQMKLREEHETGVADGDVLLTILQASGLRVSFRYEKYREEFSANGVVIAIDETPMGTFVELEGGETQIHATAAALGRAPADYLTESYRALFLRHRQSVGALAADNSVPPAGT